VRTLRQICETDRNDGIDALPQQRVAVVDETARRLRDGSVQSGGQGDLVQRGVEIVTVFGRKVAERTGLGGDAPLGLGAMSDP
jgi:hypothetical protein